MYNLMSFDKRIHPPNHQPNQDTEHFHYPLNFSPTFLLSVCISCSSTSSQASTLLISASPRISSKWNYTASNLLCLTYFLINLFIYLFVFGCFGSSLLRVGFLQLQRAGATLRCGAWASHCGGFFCCGAWALGAGASVVVARGLSSCGSRALERRLSSCGAWAQLLCVMWDLPGPGLEPVSPALAGRFLTTVPPGKSCV